ncbi:MBL fold metallo-hydrolase [Pseudoduganella sp. R-32]|uniref:MBL fold metallo-hydrolase n=1 Tax=Pseudoduganella sp. R-32 TaxID=3404061 RepID=UPI003CF5AA69
MNYARKNLSPHTAFRLINEEQGDVSSKLGVVVQAMANLINEKGGLSEAILAAAELPNFERFFEYDAAAPAASFAPRDSLLFPPRYPLDTFIVSVDERREDSFAEQYLMKMRTPEGVKMVADTLLWIAGDQTDAPPSDELIKRLDEIGCFSEAADEADTIAAAFSQDGIYRLQHASLLYVHQGQSVLIDPVLHTVGYGVGTGDLRLLIASRTCSAILISHSHGDHFEPSSLAFFPRDIPIVVPTVRRTNILTSSFVEPLKAMGFINIIEADWWSNPLNVGDIKITALPFYGEQPRSTGYVRNPELRNIGNTYLITTPTDKTWVVVDTGNEVEHKMVHVAEAIAAKFGKIRHIACNLGRFTAHTPHYCSGSGSYWACLSNEDMANFSQLRSECVTLGPKGVAEIIAASGCERFIPYADWWGEMDQPSMQQEKLTKALQEQLKGLGSACSIADVNIGGVVRLP